MNDTINCRIAARRIDEMSLCFCEYNDTYAFEASDKEAAILERLLKQIEQLPTNVKQVFKMHWLNNLKFREIAEQMGADISTIKKRYSRALTILKK